MSFTYSGTVKEITDGLAVALPAFQQDGILTGAPVGAGSCVVAPSGASGSISGGTFSVSATDDPSVLTGYRLVLTAELANAATDVARVAFRSPDLFRTGSGWTENDLDIWLHVIDDSDLVALAAAKIDFPLPLPYSSLQSQLSPSLPKGVVVTGVQGAKGLLSISMQFHQGSFPHSLSGSFTVSVTPDTSSDYQSYISLQLVDLNLDGLTGWVAEFTSEDQIPKLGPDRSRPGRARVLLWHRHSAGQGPGAAPDRHHPAADLDAGRRGGGGFAAERHSSPRASSTFHRRSLPGFPRPADRLEAGPRDREVRRAGRNRNQRYERPGRPVRAEAERLRRSPPRRPDPAHHEPDRARQRHRDNRAPLGIAPLQFVGARVADGQTDVMPQIGDLN